MTAEAMLEFEHVTYTWPGDAVPVIEDLSFTVSKGEFVCLIGPSGCGKSTILRLTNGLLKPEGGRILIRGKDISTLSGCCGYMPQQDLLFPWRTVGENIRLPLEIKGGMSRAEMDRRVDEALTSIGLEGLSGRSPSELSGGMRQRAAFARTLLTGSELLLLDEPFSALDYLTRLSMREWLLEQWEREKKTVLFITHDVEEAVFLSGRVLAASGHPLRALTSSAVPSGYPRTIECLRDPAVASLREELILKLRKEQA